MAFPLNFKTKVKIVGGCPTASNFLLLRQKKVAKEKATPLRRPFGVPCVARLARRLRNSRYALRQSSPKSLTSLRYSVADEGKEKRKSKATTTATANSKPASKARFVYGHFVPIRFCLALVCATRALLLTLLLTCLPLFHHRVAETGQGISARTV